MPDQTATTHACPDCGQVHLPPDPGPRQSEQGVNYCRHCGKTLMVEWLHRDCELEAVLDLIRAQGTAKEPQSLGEP